MKHTYKIISVSQGDVVIDEQTEIKEGDWYIRDGIVFKVQPGTHPEYLKENQIIFFGDGASKCREKITHPNAQFVEGVYPAAAHMGEPAFEKFTKGQFEDLLSFEPHYLKEFLIRKPDSI